MYEDGEEILLWPKCGCDYKLGATFCPNCLCSLKKNIKSKYYKGTVIRDPISGQDVANVISETTRIFRFIGVGE